MPPPRQASNAPASGDELDLKQRDGESILEFSLRLINSIRGRVATEDAKMELFKKNLLPNLAQLLEIEDRRKKFATLTGMACFLEQRSQAIANPANGIPNQMSAPENASTENSLVNDILSENDRLRQRLTHGTTLTNESVVNRVDS